MEALNTGIDVKFRAKSFHVQQIAVRDHVGVPDSTCVLVDVSHMKNEMKCNEMRCNEITRNA